MRQWVEVEGATSLEKSGDGVDLSRAINYCTRQNA